MTYSKLPRKHQPVVELKCANPKCDVIFPCPQPQVDAGRKYCSMKCNLQDRFKKI